MSARICNSYATRLVPVLGRLDPEAGTDSSALEIEQVLLGVGAVRTLNVPARVVPLPSR